MAQLNINKPRDVVTRLLEPMTITQVLVFTRSEAYNPTTGEYAPYSCRMRNHRHKIEYVTILGVVMPDKSDLQGEPTPRILAANKYFDLLEILPLRESLKRYASEIEYVATHGNLYQLQFLNSELQRITNNA